MPSPLRPGRDRTEGWRDTAEMEWLARSAMLAIDRFSGARAADNDDAAWLQCAAAWTADKSLHISRITSG
jgi:hypothetical protein